MLFLKLKILLQSNKKISKICFGCEPLGGTDWGDISVPDIANAIHRALELGVNFFDTAATYGLGLSESRLSEILGSKRHDVIIASKGGLSWEQSKNDQRAKVWKDSSPNALRLGIESSLKRLRIDYLPIYYIHWPDPVIDIRLTFETLATLQIEGKIGKIGCSNFNAGQVDAACEASEVSYIQLALNLLNQDLEPELRNSIRKNNISIIAYNVLANGLLTGKYNETSTFTPNDRRSRLSLFKDVALEDAINRVSSFKKLAAIQNQSCAQYAISKIINMPYVESVILGIKNRTQIEENCALAEL